MIEVKTTIIYYSLVVLTLSSTKKLVQIVKDIACCTVPSPGVDQSQSQSQSQSQTYGGTHPGGPWRKVNRLTV